MSKEHQDPQIQELFTRTQPKAREDFRDALRSTVVEHAQRQEVKKQRSKKKSFIWVMLGTPALVGAAVVLLVVQFAPEVFESPAAQPLFTQTVSASEVAATITEQFFGDADGVHVGTRTNGDMAIAYATNDEEESITVVVYTNAQLKWSRPHTLRIPNNDTVDPDSIKIHAVDDAWLMSWYVHPKGEGDQVQYMVTILNNEGEVTDELSVMDAAVDAEDVLLQVVPGTKNDAHVLWKDGDEFYLRYWTLRSEWATDTYALNSIAADNSMRVLDVSENAATPQLFIVGKNATGYGQAALVRVTRSAYEVAFQQTLHASDEVNVLDVQEGQNGELFVLYQLRNVVFSRRLSTAGDMSEATELFSLRDEIDFSHSDIQALYNPYGDGQYVVVWREYNREDRATTLHYRYWIPRTNWQDAVEFYSSERAVVMPHMIGFTSGFVQLLWKDDKLYMKQYDPAQRVWSENASVPEEYGNIALYKPFEHPPVRSVEGTKSLVMFEDTSQQQLLLKKWHVGTDPADTQTISFPRGYDYIYHTSNDQYYSVIMQEDNTLKSVIYEEGQLFETP